MTDNVHHAIHPNDFKRYDTEAIRRAFLLENLFIDDKISLRYTHYDRYVVGGAKPVTRPLKLEPMSQMKATSFLERRELGVVNVGADATITVNGVSYEIKSREALYAGRAAGEVVFHPAKNGTALFYINSAPAHTSHPTRKVSREEAETVELGSLETSNHRVIRKLLVNSVLPTCQLQMGLTELKTGSVWNTMPAHTHDRRMEAYFYFDLPEGQLACHFLGEPSETRHIWVQNLQAVLSPPWSIHCGAGTSSYSFIWGMAGENMDYSDMDTLRPQDLR